ncbi:hypothetical protein [Streptomyces sp. NPDC059063]|uniref:hypothetical protein n=1 Tax=Streptomyces sp. NPDC059063 TaxID=3346712 RepID=UPI0036791002
MSYADNARTLDALADALEDNPRLNPDTALRLAVWGDRNARFPGDGALGATLFTECESAMECRLGWPAQGIAHVDRLPAISAARAEAARFRSYTLGSC